MDEYTTLTIEGQEVLISSIDFNRINKNIDLLNIHTLAKFIFRADTFYKTGLRLYHKNNNPYDFRRNNLILTNKTIINQLNSFDLYKGQYQSYMYCPIGIHLDPFSKVVTYQVIIFEKDKLVIKNVGKIDRAIEEFNSFRDNYKKRYKWH